MKARVLLVEDETTISEPLGEHLAREGFEPRVAASIAQATEAFEQFDPDFVLLDVMLPDGDGRDLCRDIRKHSDVPIIMLTARGEEIDRIVGLELGADDYVVKPFSAGELVARMRAITRRGRPNERKTPMTVGAITLDPASRIVTKDGETVELAAKEFDLLAYLMSMRRRRRTAGADHGRGVGPPLVRSDEDARRACVLAPRKIEDDPRHPRYITTVRGVGFRFASPDDLD